MLTIQYILFIVCMGCVIYTLLHTTQLSGVIVLGVAFILFLSGMDIKAYRHQTNICEAMSKAGIINATYDDNCGLELSVGKFIAEYLIDDRSLAFQNNTIPAKRGSEDE